MSDARNQLVATRDHIKTLYLVLSILLIIIIALWFRNGHLQEIRRIFIPPNLSSGTVTSFDQVPPPVVYTFALYIFQQLNRWPSDGEKDYPEKIYRLQGYLTPSCIIAFQHDMSEKRRLGELRKRARMMEEISGRGFDSHRVSSITDSSWNVTLDLKVQETISNHQVKNVNLRYDLRIVTFDVDKEVNPWGLALECDGDFTPTLLSDDDLKNSATSLTEDL